jgi:hypothetical protein
MHEVPEPPKKGIPYPWIVAGLSALSLSLLIITVTDGLEAAKNEKALAASRAEAAHQGSLMQAKVDTLTAEHGATSRSSALRQALRAARDQSRQFITNSPSTFFRAFATNYGQVQSSDKHTCRLLLHASC